MARRATQCMACFRGAPPIAACSRCGKKIKRRCDRCAACRIADRSTCYDCGGEPAGGRRRCEPCHDRWYAGMRRLRKDRSCLDCGKPRHLRSFRCWDCSLQYRKIDAAARRVCECGQPKAPSANRCFKCRWEQPPRPRRWSDSDMRIQRQARKYGITVDDVRPLFDAQAGACAICQAPFGAFADYGFNIDHCHATGAVRGLLCRGCNHGLGAFRDSEGALGAAIRYLVAARSADVG